jgi:hypothetical protein
VSPSDCHRSGFLRRLFAGLPLEILSNACCHWLQLLVLESARRRTKRVLFGVTAIAEHPESSEYSRFPIPPS